MKTYIRTGLLASILLTSTVTSFADNASANSPDFKVMKNNLQKNLPDLTIDQIVKTPFNGVYEVDSGRKVFYVDSTGNFALIGNMLDLTSKASLTEQRTTDLNIIDWKKIPTDLAIQHVKGNGASKIAIFTDPDCPFCKRLENETVAKLTNVTIYYFLFPLAIHPNAADDSKRILCAENPESAIQAFMVQDKSLSKNISCSNANKLQKMQDIGTNLVQVTGTPTIVLPNGRIISGLVPADYLTRMIDANQSESVAVVQTTKK